MKQEYHLDDGASLLLFLKAPKDAASAAICITIFATRRMCLGQTKAARGLFQVMMVV